MEARSLSSLNFLAANPPQYPNKPNEERQDPLTLYILRVPGTRDVFLSPFKPQIKSVTAEDIASSLYYVHLRDPEDEYQARQSEEHSRERSPSQPSIARKPLPSNARPLTPDSPPQVPQLHTAPMSAQREVPLTQNGPESSEQPRGPPLSQITIPARPPSPMNLTRIPARKPLGPRPMASSPTADNNEENRPQLNGRPMPMVPQRLRTQGTGVKDRHSMDQGYRADFRPGPDVKSGSFSLDLIRRDRSSGGQWNVARITCQGTEASVSGLSPSTSWRRSPSPSKQSLRPAINISIQNSGYAKFRNIPLPSVVEAGPAAIMSALAERDSGRSSDHSSNLSLPLCSDASAALGDVSNGGYFSRQVTMGYTKSWTANMKEKLQKLELEARSRTGHKRGDSGASWEPFEQKATPAETGAEGMRARGYDFNSPWNGRCEFRTGNAGRTLRLTHFLDHGSSNGSSSHEAELVSELRFNLPTYEAIPNAARPRDSQLLKDFGNALRSRARSDPYCYENEYDDDDRDHPRFDLSLGKERAGGGRRGNRAKMGKLIITNEGLKMLDLVVAANMGVWWEAWEKSF